MLRVGCSTYTANGLVFVGGCVKVDHQKTSVCSVPECVEMGTVFGKHWGGGGVAMGLKLRSHLWKGRSNESISIGFKDKKSRRKC